MRSATERAAWRWLFVFVGPTFLLYTVLWFVPMIANFGVSLTVWKGVALRTVRFAGLANFVRLFQDQLFYLSLYHNSLFVVATMMAKVVLAFAIALLVERVLPFRTFFRTTLFLPVILPFIVTALLWRWLLNPVFGLVNPILDVIGLGFLARNWLGDSGTALASLMVVEVWKHTPFHMVIFLAALQKVPRELEESAAIDGAGPTRVITSIIVPLLRPVFNIVIALNMVQGFRVFTLVYAMTSGGPAHATEVLSTYIVQTAFQEHNMGYAAAQSVMLFLVVFAVAMVFLQPFREHEVQY